MSKKKKKHNTSGEETATLMSEAEVQAEPTVSEEQTTMAVSEENVAMEASEAAEIEPDVESEIETTDSSLEMLAESEESAAVAEADPQEEDLLAEFGASEAEVEGESFLPESAAITPESEMLASTESVEGTELDAYESAEIEDVEFVEEERLDSILESILFASDRPVSLASIKMVFKGTNIRGDKIKRALDRLAVELAGGGRGVSLEEVPGGYQLRTKIDNMNFITRTLKARPFRLSGPALEVLAIAAYKQPLVKSEIDEIRGVESGHLLRALMEKNLITFGGKSDLPGKPMQYETTKKFLEIFGLRNLQELPTLSQIDELLPEGIGEEEGEKKTTLSQLTDSLSEQVGIGAYSQGEEELNKITSELEVISASSDFFEQEKLKQKQKREAERAQNIREAILMGEQVSNRDRNWLTRFDEAQMLGQKFEDFDADKDSGPVSTDTAPVEASAESTDESASEIVETPTVDEDEQLFSEESLEANDIADID